MNSYGSLMSSKWCWFEAHIVGSTWIMWWRIWFAIMLCARFALPNKRIKCKRISSDETRGSASMCFRCIFPSISIFFKKTVFSLYIFLHKIKGYFHCWKFQSFWSLLHKIAKSDLCWRAISGVAIWRSIKKILTGVDTDLFYLSLT